MRTHERELLHRRRRRFPAHGAVAALVACAVLAAGCGGGSGSPGVASIAATTSATAKTGGDGKPSGKNQTFSACMRAHGVPNFPDPKFSGGMTQISIDAKNGGIDPGSPIFQAAQKTCQKLMPGRPGGPGGGPTTHVGGNGPASGGATPTGSAGK
jgi:hypothetical protein